MFVKDQCNFFKISLKTFILDIMTNDMRLYFINIFNRLCKDQTIYTKRVKNQVF